MTLKKTNMSLKAISLSFIAFSFMLVQFSGSVLAAPQFLDVDRDNTVYAYDVGKNIIIATRGSNVTVFQKENQSRWKQTTNYYSKTDLVGCPAHIDAEFGRGQGSDPTKFTLFESEKGSCSDDEYHIGEVSVEIPASEDMLKLASAINWGNEPWGCPNFGKIPNGTNKKDLDYNCPEGGAVINGEFKKNKKISTPGAPQVDADCTDVGGAFNWIICGLGSLAAEATKVIDNVMYSLLSIPVSSWEESGVKAIWESMRTISSVLIVLVSLVAIASQIFNFDFVSTYTIRKVIPKLFIAVILIQLSWFLGTMAVTISNTVGYSIQALITAPVEAVVNDQLTDNTATLNTAGDGWIGFADVLAVYAESANQDQLSGAGVTGIFAIGMRVAAGSAYAAGPAIVLIIASALITGTIAMMVAFAVIALRYVLILALVVIMPLALVAWILPSTSKWFDRWWSMFFALLAMFPIVIAVLTFGKVAAVIIALSAAGG